MHPDRRSFLLLFAAGSATFCSTAFAQTAAAKPKPKAPVKAKPQPTPPPSLTGPNAAPAIQALKPGQFFWMPRLAPAGPITAIVSLAVQRCYVYRNGIIIAVSTVSSGKQGHRTPTGVFTILQKHIDHKSSIYDAAPMPYMQRLTWDGIALHAGNLPGYPASHGCVRMPMAFAKLLYGETKTGMTVVVTDSDSVPRVAPMPDLLQAAQALEPNVTGIDTEWHPERSPEGPMSLVLSGTDKRLLVLRNGVLIGSAPVTIDGPIEETMAFTLNSVEGNEFHWLQLPLPGQSWEGERMMTPEQRGRVRMGQEFRALLDAQLQPGTTLVVTNDSMRASSAGKKLTVIDATK